MRNVNYRTRFELKIETIYLRNGSGNYPDKETNPNETDDDYRISGKSWLKLGVTTASDIDILYNDGIVRKVNFAPVYGLRFQGTSQCAAYRWESCKISDNEQERYLSIKIKALGKDDMSTTINDIAKESYWAGDYIEFRLPSLGVYYPNSENISARGTTGYYWSSTKSSLLYFSPTYAEAREDSTFSSDCNCKFALYLVRVEE